MQHALDRSGGCCQICGNNETCKVTSIYYPVVHENARRKGTKSWKWKDSTYMSSSDNLLVLCLIHRRMINCKSGLELYTVDFLESLYKEPARCTALTEFGNRCVREAKVQHRCKVHIPMTQLETKILRDADRVPDISTSQEMCCILL